MKPLVALVAAVLAFGLAAPIAPAHAERDGVDATVEYAGHRGGYGYGYGYGHGYGHGSRHYRHERHGGRDYLHAEPYRYKRYLKRRLRRRYSAYPPYPRRLPVSAIVYRVERRHGVRVSAIRFSAGAYSVWGHDRHGRAVKLVVGPGGRLLAFYYLT